MADKANSKVAEKATVVGTDLEGELWKAQHRQSRRDTQGHGKDHSDEKCHYQDSDTQKWI